MNTSTANPSRRVHVVAAVIRDAQGKILIAQRHPDAHQGGLWEFPGGKLEAGEAPAEALKREIFEELDIRVEKCAPFIQIHHHYPDKSVFLDVWEVTGFSGEAYGKEGQDICWVMRSDLQQYQFPPANQAILDLI